MKNIKFMFVALVAIFVTLGSTSVYAQEDGNRDANGYVVKGPYLTNGGGANWFVGVGGGVNTFYNNLEVGNLGIAVNANIGKWFTPSMGLRVGYNGLTNNVKTNPKFNGMFFQHYVHGDVLFNISNALSGYKETRFWDFVPFVQTGLLMIHDKNGAGLDREIAVGAGLINELRLSRTVNLNIELGAVVTKESQFCNPAVGPVCVLPSATIGLSFNLGKKKNFDRYSTVAPPVLPFTLEDYEALNKRVGSLEAENSDLKSQLIDCKNRTPEVKEVIIKETQVLVGSNIITFPIGSCVLSKVEASKVEAFAKNLVDGTLIRVVGSADSKTGTEPMNYALSKNRANVVKNALIKCGVAEERIEVAYTVDATDKPETSRSAILTLSVE